MVIKNLSWKHFAPEKLFDYIDDPEKSNEQPCYWNITIPSRKQALKDFRTNDSFLNLKKNSNRLIHEIISFSPEDGNALSREIIYDLTDKYLEIRASKNLGFYQIHHDKDHYHVHIALTPNEYRSSKVTHFNRKEYFECKQEIERYQLEKYPELKNSIVYLDNSRKKKPQKQAEYELKKRTGSTNKQVLSRQIQSLFQSSHTLDEFFDNILKETNWELYTQRGKTRGVIINKKKYRFTTLGISKEEIETLQHKERSEIEKRRKELESSMNTNNITIER